MFIYFFISKHISDYEGWIFLNIINKLFTLLCRLIDESPRWLWAQGRISEAVTIVEKGIKVNGGEPIDKAHYVSRGKATSASAEDQSYSVLDMFRTPKLRIKSLNVCLNWWANTELKQK